MHAGTSSTLAAAERLRSTLTPPSSMAWSRISGLRNSISYPDLCILVEVSWWQVKSSSYREQKGGASLDIPPQIQTPGRSEIVNSSQPVCTLVQGASPPPCIT